MIYRIARMTSLVLAFGFFLGCTAFENLAGSGESAEEDPDGGLQTELESVNRSLEEGEATPRLYFRKGQVLRRMAAEEDPAARTPLYREMRAALTSGRELAGPGGGKAAEEIRELLQVSWSNEHNSGLRYSGADTSVDSLEEANYSRAVDHFRNAVAILPDSLVTYRVMAETHYRNDRPERAISILEDARKVAGELPAAMAEQLGFLYSERGSYERAIDAYEEGRPRENGDPDLARGLANAYMEAGRHGEALELLNWLRESEPENRDYRLAAATERYFAGRSLLADSVPGRGARADTALYREADDHFRRAEAIYGELSEEEPENGELRRQIAGFYQNVASLYRRRLAGGVAGEEGSPPDSLLREYIRHYLAASLPHLEELSSAEEGDAFYTRRLLAVYRYLGMEEEAEELRDNRNL